MSQGQTMQQSVAFNLRQLRNRKTIFDRGNQTYTVDTKLKIDKSLTPEKLLAFKKELHSRKNRLLRKRLLIFVGTMIVIFFGVHYLNTHLPTNI